MKRLFVFALSVLMILSLVSCKKNTYKIEYKATEDIVISSQTRAKAGELVEIQTGVYMDADVKIYVDGDEIPRTHYDSDYWGYEFTMPARDVIITAEIVGGFF